MVLMTRIVRNLWNRRISIRTFSVANISSNQAETQNKERTTHFGFEQVTESEKDEKGKTVKKKILIIIYAN